jgi:hypothetical protein
MHIGAGNNIHDRTQAEALGMIWQCADCGWTWPLPVAPPDNGECDRCGGGEFKQIS